MKWLAQVRHGDTTKSYGDLKNGTATVQQYHSIFNCAEEVNRTRNTGNQRLVFYLMSDSMSLRRHALAYYGNDTLLTAVDGVEVTHVAFNHLNEEHLRDALLTAAGEMWAFGYTDVQVISKHSGFGALGSFWGHTWHSR